jgi:ADP-heptose:LPS heptosyltransferase
MLSGWGWYTLSAFATARHVAKWRPGTLHRILVIKTDHIGDFLLCLPAVRDFSKSEPEAEVGFVVSSDLAPLAERVPWIREVHAFDSPRYARRRATSPPAQLREAMARGWDLVIDLTNDPAATLEALRRPSRYRRDVGSFRLREKVRAMAHGSSGLLDTHATDVFYRALGMEPPRPIVPEGVVPREEERAEASRLIARGWPGERPVVAVHAGATWEFRKWPAARFADVIRELERRGFAAYLIGGQDDRRVSAEIAEAAGLRPERNLAGECTLPVTAAVLSRAAGAVANDGGLMHLAVAQGAATVGIFGPTSPERFGPLGARSVALWRRRDCSPCAQRHCIWGAARCLDPIESSQVVEASTRLLSEPAR